MYISSQWDLHGHELCDVMLFIGVSASYLLDYYVSFCGDGHFLRTLSIPCTKCLFRKLRGAGVSSSSADRLTIVSMQLWGPDPDVLMM